MNKKILLIADDDEMSRKVIQKNFSDTFDVIESRDGKETLEIIHNRPVDIVILDIVMPQYNGFEVLKIVKCDEKYSDIRILVATSLYEKTEKTALELGADDIVFKPYDPVVIKKRINNLLTMQEQKRELENALLDAENANKAKTNFLSRISHDMRTPLNGILGITTLLKDTITDPKSLQDLEQLEMSGHYLLNLVNDTLDVNKIEMGKLELHPGAYDGRSIVNNVVNLIKPVIEKKKIKFHVHADNLPYTILYIDMGRVEQIIMNILGNAAKFTPEGGTIEASITNLSNKDGIITDQIVISDNGIGMSPEFLPHLFDPFSQENPGSTGNTTGTGLGMTITKQIVELMGGTISVESTQGKGTTFTIVMPFQVATENQIKEWKRTNDLVHDDYEFHGRRVLLCEDHPLNAEITIRLLEKKGIIVEHAENGKIGLEMYEASDLDYYDMILMDVRMPEMDGLEATRRIRALNRKDAHRIPIIAMTANALYEDVEQVKAAGMDAHLGKPIELDKLFQCFSEMLHLSRQTVRKKILIVDDIEMNRAVIREVLESEFDILEAEDGYTALDVLHKNNGIDMIITDIQMPKMNGLEMIKTIRKDQAYNRIAIIANTQFGDPEQEEEILDAGANDFVYKPTTPKIIELRVRNTMNRL